jgi:Mg2+ and Co2+ transporter CorA
MYYICTYSKSGIRQKNQISQIDLEDRYQIWMDLEDPTSEELSQIQEIFLIDNNILNQYVTGLKNLEYEFYKITHSPYC